MADVRVELFSYEQGMPVGYRCTCGVQGRLWRLSHTFLEHQELFCVGCAHKRCPDTTVTFEGGNLWEGLRTDTFGGGTLVPAVPTEDGETFWGYTSVPDAGVRWWKALPLYVGKKSGNNNG